MEDKKEEKTRTYRQQEIILRWKSTVIPEMKNLPEW